jgi:hypothetical protein
VKHIEFLSAVIKVYGEYSSDILQDMTMEYIKTRWEESELDGVFKKLILNKSAKYKTPPDPAEFQEMFFKQSDAQVEIEAAHFYDMMNNTGCSLDNIIVSDIRAQKALVSVFGSWPDFCQRNPEGEQWHRKNFIAAFIKNHEGTDEKPSIMYGESSQRFYKLPIAFGDKDKCNILIEEQMKPLQINTDFIRRAE